MSQGLPGILFLVLPGQVKVHLRDGRLDPAVLSKGLAYLEIMDLTWPLPI